MRDGGARLEARDVVQQQSGRERGAGGFDSVGREREGGGAPRVARALHGALWRPPRRTGSKARHENARNIRGAWSGTASQNGRSAANDSLRKLVAAHCPLTRRETPSPAGGGDRPSTAGCQSRLSVRGAPHSQATAAQGESSGRGYMPSCALLINSGFAVDEGGARERGRKREREGERESVRKRCATRRPLKESARARWHARAAGSYRKDACYSALPAARRAARVVWL